MDKYLAGLFACLLFFLASPAASRQIELEFAVWSNNPAHLELLNGIADAYRSEHPNVSVKFITIQPYSAFPRNITIRVTGSNPPDASWMLERLAPQFIDAGTLVDLGQAAAKYDFADFAKPALSLWVHEQAVYGLPFSTSPFFIIYNKEMLAQAGVPPPAELIAQGAWTWENFQQVAKTIKANTGRYAYSFWMDDDAIFALTPIIRAYGDDAWDEHGVCGLNSPRSVQAMRLFHRMLAVDRSIAPPKDTSDFFAGEVAMTIAQLSMVGKLKEVHFAWDIAPLPAGPAGKIGLLGQAAVVVYKAGKHQETAADFAAFLTNKQNVIKLAKYFPPARLSVIESETFLRANPLLSVAQMKSAVADGLKTGKVLPFHQDYGKIELAVRAQFNRLLAIDADIATIAGDMCRAVNSSGN